MAFAPNTTLYLIGGVLIDNKYQHTYRFANADDQKTYFSNKTFHTINDFTIVRKDHPIRVPYNLERLSNINYCMFRNVKDGVGKWFYCFVNKKTYINDGLTELDIETDVMQTYQFDYEHKPCFVDREHTDRWFQGSHMPVPSLIDENLGYGDEYVQEWKYEIKGNDVLYFLLVTTEPIDTESAGDIPKPLQGVPTPFFFYIIPHTKDNKTFMYQTNPTTLVRMVNAFDLSRLLSDNPAVISASYIPYLPFALTWSAEDSDTYSISNLDDYNDPVNVCTLAATSYKMLRVMGENVQSSNREIATINRYAGLTLPNVFTTGMDRHYKYESKLYQFPYSYLMLSDFQSQPMLLKDEYRDDIAWSIHVSQNLSHQPKTKYYAASNKGELDGKVNCIINNTVNDLPLITDAYKQYMMANKSQATAGMALAGINAAANLAIGAATGGLGLAFTAGNIMSGASVIVNELAKRKDLQNIPDSVRHSGNNISFDIADDNTKLKVMRYSIHEQFKKVLGDFWAMYGYKCNEVKVPNVTGRYYYNYVKTIGCVIEGEMDTEAKSKIRSIFDMGVTIWHYHYVGFNPLDYSKENIETSLL